MPIGTKNWDVETYRNKLDNKLSFCVGRKLPGQPIINHHLVANELGEKPPQTQTKEKRKYKFVSFELAKVIY